MTRSDRMRLFFALWPPPDLRQAIAALVAEKPGAIRGRPVPPQNYHLTLAFLGNATRPQTTLLIKALQNVSFAPFELTFDHIGFWARPRIVWLAPSENPGGLLELVDAMWARAKACGFEPEIKAYRPHVTLARKASRPQAPIFAPLRWQVREFVLAKSETLNTGARYTALAHFSARYKDISRP